MEEKKNIKICFAASSGGHYEQLMMLKPLMEEYDSFVVTEQTDYSAKAKGEKTYYMSQVNRREKDFVWLHLLQKLESCYINSRISFMYSGNLCCQFILKQSICVAYINVGT